MIGKPALPLAGSRHQSRAQIAVISLALALTIFLLGTSLWPVAYRGALQISRWRLEQQLSSWPSLTSDHYIIKYRPQDEAIAPLVLTAAEKAYHLLTREANYTPPGQILVVIYPSSAELNAVFGWSAQESALGVYWGGAIQVLSPSAWIEARDSWQLGQIFWATGLMVHELSHLILDYKTAGNYPRWFSEGLAQYREQQHCQAAQSAYHDLDPALLYTLPQLEQFNQLDNEQLAYRQSLSLVEYLVAAGGPNAISTIVDSLAGGATFSQALQKIGISSPAALEQKWLAWLK